MTGMVRICLQALAKQKVTRITRTFVSISIAEVAQRIGMALEQAVSLLENMVSDGEVNATVSPDGMVVFGDIVAPDQILDSSIERVESVCFIQPNEIGRERVRQVFKGIGFKGQLVQSTAKE